MKRLLRNVYILSSCCLSLLLYPMQVSADVALVKQFTDDPVVPGDVVSLEFTISNPGTDHAATDITFTDDLRMMKGPGQDFFVVPPFPNPVCGTFGASFDDTVLNFTDGSLDAGASCDFSVNIQVPDDITTRENYTNVTSEPEAMVNGVLKTGTRAFDELEVDPFFVDLPKSCFDVIVNGPTRPSIACADADFRIDGADGIPGFDIAIGSDSGQLRADLDALDMFDDPDWGDPPPGNLGEDYFAKSSLDGVFNDDGNIISFDIKQRGNVQLFPRESTGQSAVFGGHSLLTFTPISSDPDLINIPLFIGLDFDVTQTDPSENEGSGGVFNAVSARLITPDDPANPFFEFDGSVQLELETSSEPLLDGSFANFGTFEHDPDLDDRFRTLVSRSSTLDTIPGRALELEAGNFGAIFTDGFESGDTSAWSSSSQDTYKVGISSPNPAVHFKLTAEPDVPSNLSPIHRFINFNNDAKGDVLLRDSMSGEWLLEFMNFRFVRPNSGPAKIFKSQDWEWMGSGDFAGNGRAGVLLRHKQLGVWQIFLMNGRNSTSGPALITPDSEWVVAAVDDFNGDGKADVLMRNRFTGEWQIFFMNFRLVRPNSGPTTLFSDLDWEYMGTGDFAGSGRAGVLLRHRETGEWWIYLMNGRAHTSGGTAITTDMDWQIAGIDDFNGDGKDDVLLRNRVTGRWWINFMNFRLIRPNSGPTALFANQNWEMRGTGDFTGKGRAGIALRHKLTGGWWIFLMNGRTATSGGTSIIKNKNWELPPLEE